MARKRPTPPPAPEEPGGLGGGTARDTRLLARAAAEHWPLTPEARALAVEKLVAVLKGKASKPREQIAAARALVSMSGPNLQAIDMAIRVELHEDIRKRLEDLEELERGRKR